jgi:hypothetical protein
VGETRDDMGPLKLAKRQIRKRKAFFSKAHQHCSLMRWAALEPKLLVMRLNSQEVFNQQEIPINNEPRARNPFNTFVMLCHQ